MNNSYFEALSEQEGQLEASHDSVQKTINLLIQLANDNDDDNHKLELLKRLNDEYPKLLKNNTDLYHGKFNAISAKIENEPAPLTIHDSNVLADEAKDSLEECVNEIEEIYRNSQKYINMVNRLSVDLAKQIETADIRKDKYIVDNWLPPKEIEEILQEFTDDDSEAVRLRARLEQYLDQLKMERVKYTLENRYTIEDKLILANKEVNRWRIEWDKLETLMFGRGPNSLKNMLQKNEQLAEKLKSAESQ
ncbi:hypothetical protein TBLA_0B07960 [Henningerozyma blattae CBS 6284]|uniref:Uncharacterized protein n=1 Tax=Henningerozyma blattae (strain ATCC 34711 / CBS 6284 / DSM 70876 / NBRC 10599 / NRRL Y-10934 / UCD 77-7) TaxID=1071380 RepID=I2GZR0_HENB6|nr:hypothetical protein TBLA_0B07960 [Tetrapisispora blattae CBS 6284]CCH59612.1 hypothetical protein TBLA_0B07960 [Tetrapisispora blattae CBS 6284]